MKSEENNGKDITLDNLIGAIALAQRLMAELGDGDESKVELAKTLATAAFCVKRIELERQRNNSPGRG